MSLFKKKEYQVIKFGDYVGKERANNNDILFEKIEVKVTDPDARIEVPLTHDAFVDKGVGIAIPYEGGAHDLFENKKEFKDLKKGLTVTVSYIRKNARVLLKWGTRDRILYQDQSSGQDVSVGARGELRVEICNAEKFYNVEVASKPVFDLAEFKSEFSGRIGNDFGNTFLQVVEQENLKYHQFDRNKQRIGELIGEIISKRLERDFGLKISDFLIDKIDLNEDDINAIKAVAADKAAEQERQEKIKEYLAEVERLDDKQWEREKYLRQLELQDKNAYYEVMKVVGSAAAGNAKKVEEDNKCPNCGAECKPTDKFCPRCGKRVSKDPVICPDCGKANDYNAMFCGNCGKKLVGDK